MIKWHPNARLPSLSLGGDSMSVASMSACSLYWVPPEAWRKTFHQNLPGHPVRSSFHSHLAAQLKGWIFFNSTTHLPCSWLYRHLVVVSVWSESCCSPKSPRQYQTKSSCLLNIFFSGHKSTSLACGKRVSGHLSIGPARRDRTVSCVTERAGRCWPCTPRPAFQVAIIRQSEVIVAQRKSDQSDHSWYKTMTWSQPSCVEPVQPQFFCFLVSATNTSNLLGMVEHSLNLHLQRQKNAA